MNLWNVTVDFALTLKLESIDYYMSRQIYCQDAVEWLSAQPDHSLDNIVTGICDLDETPMPLSEYLDFFYRIATLIMTKVAPEGYAIFIQTDRKYEGRWIDKSYILTDVATHCGLKLKWHKIVLLRGVGATDLHRPGYSHMLCYSMEGRPGASTADVIEFGQRLYKNGTSLMAAHVVIEFINRNHPGLVVDPFVGRGTIVAVANKYGLDAIGVDLDPEQCEKAKTLSI